MATTESAELLQEAIKDEGLEVNVIDSQISSKTANRIANKALTAKHSPSINPNNVMKFGAVSACLEAAFAAYDAVTKGMNFDEAASHISIKAVEGFAAGTISGYIFEFTSTGLIAAAAPTAVVAVAPIVLGTVTYFLVTNLTEAAVDMDAIETRASVLIQIARTWLTETASVYANSIKDSAQKAKDNISSRIETLNDLLYEIKTDSLHSCGHHWQTDSACHDFVCRNF